MPPVATLIGDMLLLTLYLSNSFPPTAASLPATGYRALQGAQLAQRPFEVTWAVDDRAITQGQRVVKSHVDAHRWAFVRFRLRVGKLNLQQDPPGRLPLQDDVLQFAAIGQVAMPPRADETHVLKVQLPTLQACPICLLSRHRLRR